MKLPRPRSREAARAYLTAAFVLFALLTASSALCQQTGRITGKIKDASSGQPLPYANVSVMGTPYGSTTNQLGVFEIDFVPVGTYVVQASYMGYETKRVENVAVQPDRSTQVDVALKVQALVGEEVVVEAERPIIDTEKTATRRVVGQEEVKIRPINTVQDAIATQPGVVLHEGQIHVRGGRSSEVKMYVDGIAITDAGSGTRNLEVSLSSLSEFELLSGGFDAEYGNVQSGVINLQTREGGRDFSGEVKYMTDDYGAPERTYDNFDNLSFGAGGPLFSEQLRYYVSGEGRFSDTYLKTGEEREDREILGGLLKVRERQYMLGSGQAKLSWLASPTRKLTYEHLLSATTRDLYSHSYSRSGYWSREYSDWSHVPLDSTYHYYNAAEHTPSQETEYTQQKLVWRDNVSPTTFYTARLAQFASESRYWRYEDPDEYWWQAYVGVGGRGTVDLDSDNDLSPETGYYRVWGDNLGWSTQTTKSTTFKADITNQPSDTHQIKGGLDFVYNELDVKELSLLIPSAADTQALGFDFFDWDRALYTSERYRHNIYRGFPTNGALFVQDRMRYEGMIVRTGLRLDWCDPGPASGIGERQIWRERIKSVLSPRLGIAHPISDRDALHFHYGRFYQMPHLTAFFEGEEDLTSEARQGSVIGYSGLEPEVTVSYQFGAEHQFSQNLAMDVTGFYKDIFGLLATERLTPFDDPTIEVYQYVNKDYASVRGFEVKVNKRFANYFSGNFTYSWLVATGVSSDENQGAQAELLNLERQPLKEIPLDWDERQTVAGFLFVSDPGNWEATFDYSYGSGTPYTPAFLGQRKIEPETVNSGRLPSHQILNIRGTKKYKLYGQEFRLFFEALNVFDKKEISTLGAYGAEYYTTTGDLGGAFVETDPDGRQVLQPLHDPSVFAEGRWIRVGVGIDW